MNNGDYEDCDYRDPSRQAPTWVVWVYTVIVFAAGCGVGYWLHG